MAVRKSTSRGRIRVGVGGWNFAPWRGAFYPRGLVQAGELAYMAGKMTSLEINSTFYGLQKPATFQRWFSETPPAFMFAVKAPRFVCNRRDLASASGAIERFLDSGVLGLRDKLGPINWQLDPGKQFVAQEMEAFLPLLPPQHEGKTLRHAIEVRHPSFAVAEFVQLARRHGIAIVLAGDAEYPQIANATASFAYLRIMGTVDNQPRGYPPAALTRWALRAKAIAAGELAKGITLVPEHATAKPCSRDVFMYVISGAKHRNPAAAQGLLERLGP